MSTPEAVKIPELSLSVCFKAGKYGLYEMKNASCVQNASVFP